MAYIFQPQSICLIEINNYIEKSRISESAENEKMSPKNVFIRYGFFPSAFSLPLSACAFLGGATIDCSVP